MKVIDRSRTVFSARTVVSAMLAMVFVYGAVFVELPYYVFQPGTAESIRDMVTVGDGGYPESGKLLLTTVGVSRTNLLKLAEAELRNFDVRKIDEVRQNGETMEEYDERQHYIMLTSQANAVQAAYRQAGIRYRIEGAGVTVLRTDPGYPAHGILAAGDLLVRAGGAEVRTTGDLTRAFAVKRPGDSVQVEYKRAGVEMEAEFTLKALPGGGGQAEGKLGIGVTTADLQRVEPEQSGKRVAIQAGEIGGPSAGLMFALEAYGRLTPDDLTKGYTIAGTGTIEADGTVGVIGGIRHKVAAAAREGADFFLAPKDWVSQETGPNAPQPVPNASEALAEAKKLGTSMKVVPVGSLKEAVAFLEKLPPKAKTPKP
ncbi:SepM family pheromone-processing serine protease [Gorillibacterium sp. sgz5001074]|uniref:SepM family pheromone-processing serine protease n=1 Tax=Gorillibacterium sp. sgz5001074 TaxID=3446695 RepID=UPI003F67A18F